MMMMGGPLHPLCTAPEPESAERRGGTSPFLLQGKKKNHRKVLQGIVCLHHAGVTFPSQKVPDSRQTSLEKLNTGAPCKSREISNLTRRPLQPTNPNCHRALGPIYSDGRGEDLCCVQGPHVNSCSTLWTSINVSPLLFTMFWIEIREVFRSFT